MIIGSFRELKALVYISQPTIWPIAYVCQRTTPHVLEMLSCNMHEYLVINEYYMHVRYLLST